MIFRLSTTSRSPRTLRTLRALRILALSTVFLALLFSEHPPLHAAPGPTPVEERTEESLARTKIYVVTRQPGDLFYNIWGHTALRVDDAEIGKSFLFDYGVFDMDPLFLVRFVGGQEVYKLAMGYWEQNFRYFAREDRGLYLQELMLTPEHKRTFLSTLYTEAQPENRYYYYHHFTNNCTTKVRDILNQVTGNKLERSLLDSADGHTYRNQSTAYAMHLPVYWTWMNTAMNERADQPLNLYEDMFLPLPFMNHLDSFRQQQIQAGERPVVGEIQTILPQGPTPDPEYTAFLWRAYSVTLAFVIVALFLWPAFSGHRMAVILNRVGVFLFALPAGLMGLLYAILWMISPHETFHENYNILILNPFLLYLPFHHLRLDRFSWKTNLYVYGAYIAVPAAGILLRLTGVIEQAILPGALLSSFLLTLLFFTAFRRAMEKHKGTVVVHSPYGAD